MFFANLKSILSILLLFVCGKLSSAYRGLLQ